MHTDQDEVSTMVYELYLCKRDALPVTYRAWIERLWRKDSRINLSEAQARKLFLIHSMYMLGCQPGVGERRLKRRRA